ncbi:nucleoporin subcomplex protein binding to Pom34-domain-containing protein [Lipomyces arxii]|uniref:nucleoporin subcomplex protein binding to Pom34-domain-containing protein n=1 Tax=Lipomyces arxii TaxID=56418 RepID=UPI0034CF400C
MIATREVAIRDNGDDDDDTRFLLLRAKFPVVFVPFIREVRRFGPDAWNVLNHMESYMQILDRDFKDYDVSPADPAEIYLIKDVCLFGPRPDGRGGMFLRKGQRGRVVPTENNLFCVQWECEYSGWAYLGRVLEHAAKIAPTDTIVKEILGLIASTIAVLDEATGLELLESVSADLEPENDVVSVVGSVLEEAMQRHVLDISVAGLEFFTGVGVLLPHRVWDYLSRSRLIGTDGHGSIAGNMLSSVELIAGEYSFTLALIVLVNTLASDAVYGKFSTNVDPQVRTAVLLQFVRHLANVYENFAYWKYVDLFQRSDIAILLARLFTFILDMVYSIDESGSKSDKINGTLFSSAQHLLDRFLRADGKPSRSLAPVLSTIEHAVKTLDRCRSDKILLDRNSDWIESTLIFAEKLVKVRSLVKRRPAQIERRLFALAGALAELFERESVMRYRVLRVLSALGQGSWPEGDEVPSLLAHLGSDRAGKFVGALKKSLAGRDRATQGAVAKFVSIVLVASQAGQSAQQGFAVLLLTGQEFNGGDYGRAVACKFEDQAVGFAELDPELAVGVVECVCLAQNTRTMTTKLKAGLVEKALAMVELGTDKVSGFESSESVLRYCLRVQLAARAVELCAILVQKNAAEAKVVVEHLLKPGKLESLAESAMRIHGYRASLHSKLHVEFDARWPCAKLVRFRRTGLDERKYGAGYVYDVGIMDQIFSADSRWGEMRGQIVDANVNLSAVDAQCELGRAWWLLIAALTGRIKSDTRLVRPMANVAKMCLQVNVDEGVLAEVLRPVVDERSVLAFVVAREVQSACAGGKYDVDFAGMLEVAYKWSTSVDVDYGRALADADTENYRGVLRLVLVCVRGLRGKADEGTKATINLVFEHVVSPAFQMLSDRDGLALASAVLREGLSVE